MSIRDRLRLANASRGFDQARDALDRGDFDAAARGFEVVVAAAGDWPDAWFNLGLAYKFLRDWPNSARCNRRAAELDPEYKEAFWNGGVAATAMRDWVTARWCWRGIDLDPGEGDGPPEMSLGRSPVRLRTPAGTGETIWGTRVDPCRLRIESVPLPESGHRWGDVILHDVVPNGTRMSGGREWSVFDELLRMDPSEHATLRASVSVPTDADSDDLHERFMAAGLGIEDWSTVYLICRQCDESTVHTHATTTDTTPIRLVVRPFGFGGPRQEVEAALAAWASAGLGREYGDVAAAEPDAGPSGTTGRIH